MDLLQIPDIEYTHLPSLRIPSESSHTSQLYPSLKPLRNPSTSLSSLLDSAFEHQPQTDTSSSDIVPQHRYNLRPLPNRRLSATDSSTFTVSALSSNSALRLLRQHSQPLSSESPHSSELVPQSYFTSGVDTASFISSDVQTAYLSGNLFSEVLIPTPVAPHVRIPQYFTSDHSRPPAPNSADYPILVDGTTIYDPQNDPRFPILTQRFIANKNSLSNTRKELELERLQNVNLELKFEVKVKFQGPNTHPIIHVAKIEHKLTPAPFEVILFDFIRDSELHDLADCKIVFYNPYSGLKYTTFLNKCTSSITYILLFYLQYYSLLLFLLLQLMITNTFHLMIHTLQILWSLIMTVKNNITFANLIFLM